MPRRIQLRRIKGWRLPPDTVKVDRTTPWGNPWTAADCDGIDPVQRFAAETAPLLPVTVLRGKNLACWCAPDAACHADVLLALANGGRGEVQHAVPARAESTRRSRPRRP